ncbi:MAG: hypothetical protein LBC87_10350 [Fibromonadaceae bacterium]|nr:hypothetical protein [Fibromonadaceae bacterium]
MLEIIRLREQIKLEEKWLFDDNPSDTVENVLEKIVYLLNRTLQEFNGMASEMRFKSFGGNSTADSSELNTYINQLNKLMVKIKTMIKPIEDKHGLDNEIYELSNTVDSSNAYMNSVKENDPNISVLKDHYDTLCTKVKNVGSLLHEAKLPTPEIKDRNGEILIAKSDGI